MTSYKVPQDVEADDKLLGPFSFRQFIYLIVTAIGIGAAWGLWMILPPLAILPLPIIVLFGALALPLRKDQPMEIYLAAILSYYIKPRKRLWSPDGIVSLVQITAPKTVDIQRTKELSQDEAIRRLGYLANISDTRGWAVRGVVNPDEATISSPFSNDVISEAQSAEDILDETNTVSQNLDHMIEQTDAKRHQEMLQRMHTAAVQPASLQQQPAMAPGGHPTAQQQVAPPVVTELQADPYASLPAQPQDPYASLATGAPETTSAQPQGKPSETTPSPDIINLASNKDLSIETIAREANRIQKKEAELRDEEVIISLR